MDATQAFHRYLWRTTLSSCRCQYSISSSRQIHLSRSNSSNSWVPRKKTTRGFGTTTGSPGEQSSQPDPTSQSPDPPATTLSPQGLPKSRLPTDRASQRSAIRTLLGFHDQLGQRNSRKTESSLTASSSSRPENTTADSLANLIPDKPSATISSRSFYDVMNPLEGRPGPPPNVTQRALDDLIRKEPTNDYESTFNLRLKPTLGRTQAVDPSRGIDVTRAIRILESKCKQNKVRADERSQKIYVRRGQRIKILRRQRWRELFKEGFLEECGRIRRMKAQGW